MARRFLRHSTDESNNRDCHDKVTTVPVMTKQHVLVGEVKVLDTGLIYSRVIGLFLFSYMS